jgi:hypothetical protein
MFVDQLTDSPRYRLNQILHTLKHVHACELPVHDAARLQEWATQAHTDRARIVEQHEFNSYMQQPTYVKASLILEAVRMLTEVAPRRRKTVKETKEPHMRTLTEGKHKPDFLDLDADGDRKEPMKQAAKQAKHNNKAQGNNKSTDLLKEDANLDKAQTLLAAKDITDRLQKMAEDAAKMAVDDLMPLVDTMKDQFGLESATAFNNVVKQQLQTVLDSIIAAKDATDNAINTMETGGMPAAPSDIGQPLPPMGGATSVAAPAMAPEGEPAPGMGAEPGAEGEIDFEKEFAASPATSGPEEEPLGRARKDVAETLNKSQDHKDLLANTVNAAMTGKDDKGRPVNKRDAQETLKVLTNMKEAAKKPRSPYAIGMSQAMKQTGDTPPLKKSTIKKAHEIARDIDKDLTESREQVQHLKQLMEQAITAYREHVSSLTENWIQQQGDLRSAVLQAEVTRAREQLQEAIAEYKRNKHELQQHVTMQEQVRTKMRKLDEQILNTPFGVMGEFTNGIPFRKLFETAELRDTWIRYNQPHVQSVSHVDVQELQHMRDRLRKFM